MKKQDNLIVLCSPGKQVDIETYLLKLGFKFEINPKAISELDKNVICHIDSELLDANARSTLIMALKKGTRVMHLLSYLDGRLGYTEIDFLSYKYFLQHRTFSILSKRSVQAAKRLMDVVFSLLLLVATTPLMLLTALAIKLESKGPVMFKQMRTGQFNKEFDLIKFRSMSIDAEKDGAQWAKKNDSRVTKVGSFIRKTRIDELPQLLNVLKGNMSLIGPRPEREVFITTLEKEIPYYRFRHAVKPGVTGLAQVKYPYGASIDDAKWKHRYDIYYIKYHNIWMDLKILLLTVKTVLFGMGR